MDARAAAPASWLLRDGEPLRDDPWQLVESCADDAAGTDGGPADLADLAALPAGPLLVPLALWRSAAAALRERGAVGVWLDSDEFAEDMPEAAAADPLAAFNRLALIALRFPALTDGRGFSTARVLRERYGYRGELRAVGAFMPDQLHYLQRCGCNAFALPETLALADALRLLRGLGLLYNTTSEDVWMLNSL